jgi:N-acetylglucosamine kinase-like BadF-type ATPase
MVCLWSISLLNQLISAKLERLHTHGMWCDACRKIFPSTVEMAVHNDGVAALASGTAGKLYGCVLIAGTGTIALGFGEDGKFARASGVGPGLGDQGRSVEA